MHTSTFTAVSLCVIELPWFKRSVSDSITEHSVALLFSQPLEIVLMVLIFSVAFLHAFLSSVTVDFPGSPCTSVNWCYSLCVCMSVSVCGRKGAKGECPFFHYLPHPIRDSLYLIQGLMWFGMLHVFILSFRTLFNFIGFFYFSSMLFPYVIKNVEFFILSGGWRKLSVNKNPCSSRGIFDKNYPQNIFVRVLESHILFVSGLRLFHGSF